MKYLILLSLLMVGCITSPEYEPIDNDVSGEWCSASAYDCIVIESFTVEFENLDGSISGKAILSGGIVKMDYGYDGNILVIVIDGITRVLERK